MKQSGNPQVCFLGSWNEIKVQREGRVHAHLSNLGQGVVVSSSSTSHPCLGFSISTCRVVWQVLELWSLFQRDKLPPLAGAFSFSQQETPGEIPISLVFIALIINLIVRLRDKSLSLEYLPSFLPGLLNFKPNNVGLRSKSHVYWVHTVLSLQGLY